jgi:hypothetical protein
MTQQDIAKIAERAYAIYLAKEPSAPAWSEIRNQHEWRDLVAGKQSKFAPANPMEASVREAIEEWNNPKPEPPVTEEPKPPRKTTIISRLVNSEPYIPEEN